MTATVEPATVEPAAVVFVAVVSFTVESAEAFGAESIPVEGRVAVTVRIRVIAVAVRGIAVASVIPRSVSTSRQAEGRNQKRAKDNQFYFHYLMRRQAGRMTSGAEDIPFAAGLATAGPAFRTLASVPT
jgi:hypothetical protein